MQQLLPFVTVIDTLLFEKGPGWAVNIPPVSLHNSYSAMSLERILSSRLLILFKKYAEDAITTTRTMSRINKITVPSFFIPIQIIALSLPRLSGLGRRAFSDLLSS